MISILLPDLRGGGAERVSINLAYALKRLGHEVEFVLMKAEGDYLAEAKSEFVVIDLKISKSRKIIIPLAKYLRKRQPYALIANMWPLTSLAVLGRAISNTKTRLLLVEHVTLFGQYASWGFLHNLMMQTSVFTTHRWAYRVAAVSKGAAKDTAKLAGLKIDRVEILYNPIQQYAQPSAKAISAAEFLWSCMPQDRILTVGSLKDQKNHALLFHAFASLSRPHARLMLVGAGDNTTLRRLAVDLGIDERVIFAGFHVDPSPFYATANLFVLPSNYEGFGNVIVEALSFGVPIVSTDCPHGPAEILDDGRWGHLVPVGDASALARAMSVALETPIDREALKRRAADFAPELAARKYLKIIGLL